MGLAELKQKTTTFLANVTNAGLTAYVDAHRDELIEALQTAQTDRARGILFALCEQVPEAAAVVTLLMNGTPQQAINNVALFDAELAEQMRRHEQTFALVQRLWISGT